MGNQSREDVRRAQLEARLLQERMQLQAQAENRNAIRQNQLFIMHAAKEMFVNEVNGRPGEWPSRETLSQMADDCVEASHLLGVSLGILQRQPEEEKKEEDSSESGRLLDK